MLLETCIVDQCLGPGQFLGRSVNPPWYRDALLAMGLDKDHALFVLLEKLEYRGFVVGYQFANFDGVHGWLDATEVASLTHHLRGLDLPEFDASFASMQSFCVGGSYPPPAPYSFEQLSLAFLRCVAQLAMAEGSGLLWGNDMSDGIP